MISLLPTPAAASGMYNHAASLLDSAAQASTTRLLPSAMAPTLHTASVEMSLAQPVLSLTVGRSPAVSNANAAARGAELLSKALEAGPDSPLYAPNIVNYNRATLTEWADAARAAATAITVGPIVIAPNT